jgi:hypothetical protein
MTFATPEYIYWEKVEGREVYNIGLIDNNNPPPPD